MNNIVFVVFRRMRRPLISLLMVYAITLLGLVVIPGQDADGNPWRMNFFHAFYFVSFMSTTIGFGEIPYEFTEAQRLWVTFSLYANVVVWLYAIGTMLTLLRDRAFQHSISERRFSRRIRRMREPFYIICGYGETGHALVRALTDRDQRVVVIDSDPDRVSILQLENLRQYVPALLGDASRPELLLAAGLEHPLCKGVGALTTVNEFNLKIAITSKLLHPDIKVFCRSDSHDVEKNMRSFGTDYIIDPYDTFARHLSMALQIPCLYLLHAWLTSERHRKLTNPVYPPLDRHWIICGYGRFGKSINRQLMKEGVKTVIVDVAPEEICDWPKEGGVRGRGTEADTLQEAGVGMASGLVAGTDNDSNNLSIIMTARELNPNLFVIARQTLEDNNKIFEAIKADIVMHPSNIIANNFRVLLGTPLLHEFMSLAKFKDDEWACQLVSRIFAIVDNEVPEVWELEICSDQAHAVYNCMKRGQRIKLGHLLAHPGERLRSLSCIPLFMLRGNKRIMLPTEDIKLKRGDHLLFCGHLNSRNRMGWVLQNEHALRYVLTGESGPQGWFWKWLHKNNSVSARNQAQCPHSCTKWP